MLLVQTSAAQCVQFSLPGSAVHCSTVQFSAQCSLPGSLKECVHNEEKEVGQPAGHLLETCWTKQEQKHLLLGMVDTSEVNFEDKETRHAINK